MGFQSKTYSLSDEVVEAIETAKETEGLSPNQFLERAILNRAVLKPRHKISRREQVIAERAASDLTARLSGREGIDYSDVESGPTTHVALLDAVGPKTSEGRGKASTETIQRGVRPKGDKSR